VRLPFYCVFTGMQPYVRLESCSNPIGCPSQNFFPSLSGTEVTLAVTVLVNVGYHHTFWFHTRGRKESYRPNTIPNLGILLTQSLLPHGLVSKLDVITQVKRQNKTDWRVPVDRRCCCLLFCDIFELLTCAYVSVSVRPHDLVYLLSIV
jgi:hypothetical protein